MPEAIRLQPGRLLEPTSMGTRGHWQLAGPRVRDVHGHVRFDGADVWVRSASDDDPLSMNGVAVGKDWLRIEPGCRVILGGMTLALSVTRPDPVGVAGGQGSVGRIPHDLEATRLDSRVAAEGEDVLATCFDAAPFALADLAPDMVRGSRPSRPLAAADPAATRIEAPAAATRMSWRTPRPGVDLAPIDVPRPRPVTPAKSGGERRLAALEGYWRRASLARRATVLLLPFALLAAGGLVARTRPAAGRDSRGSSAPIANSVAALVRTSPSSPVSPPAPEVAPPQVGGGKTLARVAADAVASGAYADAVARYDDLARVYPDAPVYREAARILRSRLDVRVPSPSRR